VLHKKHRQSRKLIHKLRYLQEECEDHDEVWEKAKFTFWIEVNSLRSHLRTAGHLKDDETRSHPSPRPEPDGDVTGWDDTDNEIVEKNVPGWAKKLYKKIALETHPDRLRNLDVPSSEKKRRLKKFETCREAMEAEEYATLLDVAIQLDIDVELSDDHVAHIDILSKKMEDHIKNICNSVEYIWFNSVGDDQKKIMILFFQQQGFPNPFEVEITAQQMTHSRRTGERPTRRTGERPEPVLSRRKRDTTS